MPLEVILSYNLTGIHRPYLVLSIHNEEVNGAGDLGVIKVPTLIGEVDLYSSVFTGRSVLPITNDLVTYSTSQIEVHILCICLCDIDFRA